MLIAVLYIPAKFIKGCGVDMYISLYFDFVINSQLH